MNTPILLETLARQALAGDREALNTLVRALQDDIYRLALRMLWNREDAEDATQEILVRIVTRLSQFEFRSQLKTWGVSTLGQLHPRSEEERYRAARPHVPAIRR